LRLAHTDAPLPDPHMPQLATVDHVPDRLLVELQQLRDFGHGQKLIWHDLNLIDARKRLQHSGLNLRHRVRASSRVVAGVAPFSVDTLDDVTRTVREVFDADMCRAELGVGDMAE
jgi:hypothetical protein